MLRFHTTVCRFIKSDGRYLEAYVEVEGRFLCVMDEFSDDGQATQRGHELEIEFTVLLSEQEGWEEIFSGNPDRKIGVEWIKGWEYQALGKVIAISPVKVDCGLLEVEDVVRTTDPSVIGEFVGFRISRLGALAREI